MCGKGRSSLCIFVSNHGKWRLSPKTLTLESGTQRHIWYGEQLTGSLFLTWG